MKPLPKCPECGFDLDDMGKYWYCTSWNCGKEWLSKKTLLGVKLSSKMQEKLIKKHG